MKLTTSPERQSIFEKVNEKRNLYLLIILLFLCAKRGYDAGAFNNLFPLAKNEIRAWGMDFDVDKWTIHVHDILPWEQVVLSYKQLYEHNMMVPAVDDFLALHDKTLRYRSLASTPASFQSMLQQHPGKQHFYETVYDEVLSYVMSHDLHPAYKSSPWMILSQMALETWWLKKIDQEFIRYNNILWLKYHAEGWVEWQDFFYAKDDCDGLCRFEIFASREACIDSYFEDHLNKPIYMDALQHLSAQQQNNPYLRMSVVARSRTIKEWDGYEKTGYATDDLYFDSVSRIFTEQNNALWGEPTDAAVFHFWLWEKRDFKKKLAWFPWYRAASAQAKADFINFVKDVCGYILPNGNTIYYVPYERSEIFSGYGQDYEQVFQNTKRELISNLELYQPDAEQKKERKKAKEVYDAMRYEVVTYDQIKQLIRDSYEEWFVPDDVVYLVTYNTWSNPTPLDNLHRDRELWAYGKRWIIVHGSASWYVNSAWNVSNGKRTLTSLDQDLSNLHTWLNRMNGLSKNSQDTYGAIVTKQWLIIQLGYMDGFHCACNAPLNEQLIWVNLNNHLFPIECTQASDKRSPTTMEPLTPLQLEGLNKALLFYKFKCNTSTVFSSADMGRNRFATINDSAHLLTNGSHTDDLSATERELLWLLSVEEILDVYYGSHGKPEQVNAWAEALYDNLLGNPVDHHQYVKKREIRKRVWRWRVRSYTLEWPYTDYARKLNTQREVIARQRWWVWSLLFMGDHMYPWENWWMDYVWAWDVVYVKRK